MWTLRSSNRKTTGESTKRPAVFTYRRASVSKKGYHFAKQFRKISALRLPFLIALIREEEIGPRSGRAGPSFSVRPEKEAKGAVLHGGRGGYSPARVSLASFSLHRAKRMKSRQRYLHHNLSLCQNNFVKILRYACFFDCLDNGKRIGPRSGRAGPPFSVRPEKEAKGAVFARHFGSGESETRSNPFGGTHKNSPPHGAQTICAPVFSPRETR